MLFSLLSEQNEAIDEKNSSGKGLFEMIEIWLLYI